MPTEEMKTTTPPPESVVEGEEQLKRSKNKRKKKKKTDGDEGQENSNLGTDGKSKKKKSKMFTVSDMDGRGDTGADAAVIHDVFGEYDMNEPTMAEKLASLDWLMTTNQRVSPS